MPDPYHYGGPSDLGKGVLNSRNYYEDLGFSATEAEYENISSQVAEYRGQIDEAQTAIDAYDVEGSYDANNNMYVYNYTENTYGDEGTSKPADKLQFTQDQMDAMLPSLAEMGEEYGVLQTSEFTKDDVSSWMDKASTGEVPTYDTDRGSPYWGLYQSSAVYKENPEYDPNWVDATGMGGEEAPSQYVVDEDATLANFNTYLNDIYEDENPSYATYWTHSQGEFGHAYVDLADQITTLAADAEAQYTSDTELALLEQQGVLDTATAELDAYLAAEGQTQESQRESMYDTYNKLFNISTTSRYL